MIGDIVDEAKSEIDEEFIRGKFSKISDEEEVIWAGEPSPFSMSERYLLVGLIFLIHLSFFWVVEHAKIQGDGLNIILRLILLIFDKIDMLGFVLFILIFARINHFLNFSTSGRWTTAWLIFIGLIPSIWVISHWIEVILELFGYNFSNPFPLWIDYWFLVLGVVMSGIMLFVTILYQISFQYVVTDNMIHIRRQILFMGVYSRVISYDRILNIKTQQSFFAKLIGFGNVIFLTEDEDNDTIRQSDEDISDLMNNDNVSAAKKVFKLLKIILLVQRERVDIVPNPANSLYGVKNPMLVYKIVNEMMDRKQGRPGLLEMSRSNE
ncbi:MAG: PH domain-containing protein [Euryarchaeota archaeon]|jgi:hypothetical protein|nr:PH domain-containing protein [Euryarchaeota archaeon]MBT3653371.1 PH domain-containing protein [Euryarchaeota archaeon]MBT3758239.1 PH domain-containing protein [Euryarchaeota archaeon]MBT4051348.1 PH domain-containing protein [Euryarchaeota archaeon]MBT4346672.1 PH domain-containing protein [Euryarchaeota archaeon]